MIDFLIIGERNGSRTNVYSSSRTVFSDSDSQSQRHSGVYEPLYSHYVVLHSRGHARELRTAGSSQHYEFSCNLIYMLFLVFELSYSAMIFGRGF